MSAASPEDRQLCRKILPESFMVWDRAGIDPFRQRVEWIPNFLGTIGPGGGIHINTRCETNLPHVFAAGDITPVPPHGTYSFGGINLGFCGVSGWVAGLNAGADAKTASLPALGKEERLRVADILKERLAPVKRLGGMLPEEAYPTIQKCLIPSHAGYLKSRSSLEESLEIIQQAQEDIPPRLYAPDAHELMKAVEVRNMMKVAHLMILSALSREESRGYHFREDFPMTDNENWLKWIMAKKEGGGIRVWAQEFPLPYIRPKEKREIPPGVRRA
ncbi:MAG: FAD-binding protein, partial [Dehalococcoidia bacterium]|nr:FAD-binding protein [Dehalococcoidia bacterium]